MKKHVAMLLIGAMTVAASSIAFAEGDKPVIGMAMIDYTNTGFIDIKNGADEAAEDYDCELIWKGCDGSVDGQIDEIRSFIQEGVDVIMIDSVNAEALIDVVNEATEAGVGVLAIGSPIAGNDNYNATYPDYLDGKFAAQVIGHLLEGQEGTVGLVAGSKGNLVSDNRQKGFEDGLAEFDNLKCVVGLGMWDASTAMTVTEDIINSNDDLLYIWCIQDGMSYGVLRAIQNSGKDIPMAAHDGDGQGLQNFEDGLYEFECLNGNARIGYWFTALAWFIANGQEMDITQYDATYQIMSDEMKQEIVDAGLDVVDGTQMQIISIDEAKEMAVDYATEFSPETYIPTLSE